jgi:hypothetical protein
MRYNDEIFLTRPKIRPMRGSSLRPQGATQEPQPSGLRTFRWKIFICNDIILEIVDNFYIVVGECIV